MYNLQLTAEEIKERLHRVQRLSADVAVHSAAYDSAAELIRIDLGYTIEDGSEIKFKSPVSAARTTGLVVYYPDANGATVSKEFAFADAHGNNVGAVDHLFAESAVVKVILDLDTNNAFVQNADTNAYIENTFIKTINGKSGPNIELTAADIGAQSDMNAAPGEPGHVLNRTHWKESEIQTIFPETEFVYSEQAQAFVTEKYPELVEGNTYSVTYNGTEFTCVCFTFEHNGFNVLALGNAAAGGGINTGEPFALGVYDADFAERNGFRSGAYALDGSSTVTISVSEEVEIVHKLPGKFLPEGVPYSEWVEGEGRTELPVTGEWCDDGGDNDGDGVIGEDEHEWIFVAAAPIGLKVGESYIVDWNSTEYHVVGQDLLALTGELPGVLLGDPVEYTTPFMIMEVPSEYGAEFGYSAVIYGTENVKDVPFAIYATGGGATILPETTITSEEDMATIPPLGLVEGNTYIVNWCGTSYTCVAWTYTEDGITCVGLGDVFTASQGQLGTSPTGEPFVLFEYPPEIAAEAGFNVYVIPLVDPPSDGVTVSINSVGGGGGREIIHQLHPKYIPGMYYTEPSDVMIVPETTFTKSMDDKYIKTGGKMPVVGQEYIVVYNGVAYNCVAKSTSNPLLTVCIGSGQGSAGTEKSDEPFNIGFILPAYAAQIGFNAVVKDSSVTVGSEITLSVKEGDIIHKVPEKYLPDSAVTKDYLDTELETELNKLPKLVDTTISGYDANFSGGSVCYGNGKFVAVSSYNRNSDSFSVAVSDDGIFWRKATNPAFKDYENLSDVVFNGSKFVVLSGDTSYYSEDGDNWSYTNLPEEAKVGTLYSPTVTSCNGKIFMRHGYRDTVHSTLSVSDDGVNWTAVNLPVTTYFGKTTYGAGKYWMKGSVNYYGSVEGQNVIISSEDGLNWTEVHPVGIEHGDIGYSWLGDKFISVKHDSSDVCISYDGIVWRTWTLDIPFVFYTNKCTINGLKFANARQYGKVARDLVCFSKDGITWSEIDFGNVSVGTICYGANKYVALGSETTESGKRDAIIVSDDAKTWAKCQWISDGKVVTKQYKDISPKPDFTQNDPSHPSYIKNLPFYDAEKTLDSMSKKTFTYSDLDTDSKGFKYYTIKDHYSSYEIFNRVKEDKSYTIVFNGDTYVCKASYYGNGVCFGNVGKLEGNDDNGVPFAIVYELRKQDHIWRYHDVTVYLFEEMSYIEYSIKGNIPKKLDEIYLPDNIRADMAQNNPLKLDYVKNRTHWAETKRKDILPEIILPATEEGGNHVYEIDYVPLVLDKLYVTTYSSMYNGQLTVTPVCRRCSEVWENDKITGLKVGSAYFDETGAVMGEGYLIFNPIGQTAKSQVWVVDSSISNVVHLQEESEEVAVIDTKFLPEGVKTPYFGIETNQVLIEKQILTLSDMTEYGFPRVYGCPINLPCQLVNINSMPSEYIVEFSYSEETVRVNYSIDFNEEYRTLGNESIVFERGSDNGVPFCIIETDYGYLLLSHIEGDVVFSLKGNKYVKIEDKYLPGKTYGEDIVSRKSIYSYNGTLSITPDSDRYLGNLGLIEGVRYTVVLNGVEYTSIAKKISGRHLNFSNAEYIAIGDFIEDQDGLSGSFIIAEHNVYNNPYAQLRLLDGSTQCTISIIQEVHRVVHKIDEKYLPDTAATKDYVDEAVASISLAETTSVVLNSSTAGSTKKFKITVDDTGTLTVSEL